MRIDADLRDQIRRDPEAIAEVVLSCPANIAISDRELAGYGFQPEGRQSIADQCFIHGRIRLREIESLSAVAGIEAVSSASEAHIC